MSQGRRQAEESADAWTWRPRPSPITLNPSTLKSQVQNAEASRPVNPPNDWTRTSMSQVCEIASHACVVRRGGITPAPARTPPPAPAHRWRAAGAAAGRSDQAPLNAAAANAPCRTRGPQAAFVGIGPCVVRIDVGDDVQMAAKFDDLAATFPGSDTRECNAADGQGSLRGVASETGRE